MITLLDVLIGLLILFIGIKPLIKKKYDPILIASVLICLVLYMIQGVLKYNKDKEFDKLKKEEQRHIEEISKHQEELGIKQQVMIEELKKLVKAGTISKEAEKKIKTIYYETVFSKGNITSEVADKLIPSKKIEK